ncbi:cytochrome b/b6 domain-containing protein [Streptomyces sp. NPDC049813]|uniref:cytochrome b/b6 domain-containing protein n=1 Tax=Streptomyces sp. NPDC049813 TaxID=3365597 RepID=UPI0037A05881
MNSPRSKRSSLPDGISRRARTGVLSAAVLLLIPVVVLTGSDAFRAALDFTTGVLSLVSLTASVVWGLVASDRLFLTSRQRLLSQGVHRATAVASLGFLLLHVTVKVALAHVTLVGALLPFGLGVTGSGGLIGIGVLAGLLMVATGVTGALRSAMASPAGLAARWRATHMLAYPAWCLALMHGLYAGRAPKTYVVVLYCLCLVAVAGAVGLRAAPRPVKRKVAARILAFLDPGRRLPGDAPHETVRGTARASAARQPSAGEPAARPAPAPAGVGFAAAYRAVSTPPHAAAPAYARPGQSAHNEPLFAASTSRDPSYIEPSYAEPSYVETSYVEPSYVEPSHAEWSYREPSYAAPIPVEPPSNQDSEPLPAQRWPAPSPPPPAEAPRSSYDPAYDTPYGGVPSYDTAYGSSDSGGSYEGRYSGPHPADEPLAEPLPGPFQAPSSGEPWTTPYGGTQ